MYKYIHFYTVAHKFEVGSAVQYGDPVQYGTIKKLMIPPDDQEQCASVEWVSSVRSAENLVYIN